MARICAATNREIYQDETYKKNPHFSIIRDSQDYYTQSDQTFL